MVRTLYSLILFIVICINLCRCYPHGDIGNCQSSSDCSFGQCCVIGMTRYSSAQCLPLGQVGDFCMMDNEPENRTLFYPYGLMIDVTNIYSASCPCDVGLICRGNVCLSEQSYEENNYLN